MVSRVIAVLALLLALLAPSVAQDRHPEGRIAATFYQAQGAAQRSKAAALPDSAFKADPEVPIHIEADRLVEVFGGAKQAVFTGIVKLQRGDFQLRTVALTAFYSGQSGFSTGGEWRAEQLTRGEARERGSYYVEGRPDQSDRRLGDLRCHGQHGADGRRRLRLAS
jgi:hypothetical protein